MSKIEYVKTPKMYVVDNDTDFVRILKMLGLDENETSITLISNKAFCRNDATKDLINAITKINGGQMYEQSRKETR